MRKLLAEIERVLPDGGGWCSLDKAHTLAALIVGLKPRLVVEIGVWTGGSLIPMLLALQHNRIGRAIAIDPWSSQVSVVNETPENAEWWGKVDHDAAHGKFVSRMNVLEVASLCDVWRMRSDDATPPIEIGLLHVDGSHTEQAIRDVERFAPHVVPGGILVLDDLHWGGGGVERAYDVALKLGFDDLYPLGTGVVMQRRGTGAPT